MKTNKTETKNKKKKPRFPYNVNKDDHKTKEKHKL